MSFFRYGGRLYEVTESGPVDECGFQYECWDLTPESGGELGRIVVPEPADGDSGEIQIQLTTSVATAVLLRWMYFVPELRSHGIDPGEDLSSVGFAAEDTVSEAADSGVGHRFEIHRRCRSWRVESADVAEQVGAKAAESCGLSFTAATKVLLASGKAAPIASLKPGQKVLATSTRRLIHCWLVAAVVAGQALGAKCNE